MPLCLSLLGVFLSHVSLLPRRVFLRRASPLCLFVASWARCSCRCKRGWLTEASHAPCVYFTSLLEKLFSSPCPVRSCCPPHWAQTSELADGCRQPGDPDIEGHVRCETEHGTQLSVVSYVRSRTWLITLGEVCGVVVPGHFA